MLFSVVVATYNRASHLPALIAALAGQDLPREEFEVILVDDGSPEPVGSFPGIRVIRQENRGSGAARMTGVEQARGRFVAFTDDDCRPVPGWLSRLKAVLQDDPDTAVAGPTINAVAANAYSAMTQEIVSHLVQAGDFAPTCNLTFPAERLRQLRGFDPAWRLAAGEDRELCSQWIASGGKIVFDPQVRVMHHHALTLGEFVRQHFAYGRGACMVRQKKLAVQPFGLGRFVQERVLKQPDAMKALLCFGIAQTATAAGFARERAARALS